jgi:5-methylcytosine-specific restriction endonuclease McrA
LHTAYCSTRCKFAAGRAKQARKRAERVSIGAEQFSHEEIFERDHWRCGVCREPVDQALKWPDPRSASLDHVRPLAADGRHIRANVQLAHLVCNMRKNAKVEGAAGAMEALVSG